MIIISKDNICTRKGSITNTITCFLAGGIRNTKKKWQEKTIDKLKEFDDNNAYALKNDYILQIFDPSQQSNKDLDSIINWDFTNLNHCDLISFYFVNDSYQSTSLFELGYYLNRMKTIYKKTLYKHFIISIEKGFKSSDKIIQYLQLILGDDYDCIVEEDANPTRHAQQIISKYKLLLAERNNTLKI